MEKNHIGSKIKDFGKGYFINSTTERYSWKEHLKVRRLFLQWECLKYRDGLASGLSDYAFSGVPRRCLQRGGQTNSGVPALKKLLFRKVCTPGT